MNSSLGAIYLVVDLDLSPFLCDLGPPLFRLLDGYQPPGDTWLWVSGSTVILCGLGVQCLDPGIPLLDQCRRHRKLFDRFLDRFGKLITDDILDWLFGILFDAGSYWWKLREGEWLWLFGAGRVPEALRCDWLRWHRVSKSCSLKNNYKILNVCLYKKYMN